jgi:translation elongation factor EF-1alpha
MAEEKLIGKITHYFSNIKVGIIKLTDGEIKIGDTVHFKGHTTDFNQQITSIQVEHQDIEKAKKGDEFGVKVDQKVKEGDEVYLAS